MNYDREELLRRLQPLKDRKIDAALMADANAIVSRYRQELMWYGDIYLNISVQQVGDRLVINDGMGGAA